MLNNQVSKVYYARVLGDFRKVCDAEKLEAECDKHVYCISNVEAMWNCADKDSIPFDYKHKAKEASTRFKFKAYNEEKNQSIIKCYPKTGRTHQIRVHLKSLGYPIANDQMYGGTIANDDSPDAV